MSREEKTVATIRSGKIKGIYQNGIYVFKGVPYAAPPVGKLRWSPPVPAGIWKDVRPAQVFGPTAPQSRNSIMAEYYKNYYLEQLQSEDCLYLNIWSPGLDDARRPVMVWIHGGRFNSGSGSLPIFDGSKLAKRGNVVVVTINYRLGPLGFLNLKEITHGRIAATGNEGLLDQIAALLWVQDNISAFGGNPDNVTIFGESAGAMSIGCLLAMPQARGLFHRAILQSGANSARPLDLAILAADKFLTLLGEDGKNIDSLRSLPTERLLYAQQKLDAWALRTKIKGAPLEPVIDGEVLPEWPLDAAKCGSAARVPVLAGSTLDEWRIIEARNRRVTKLGEDGLARHWERFLPSDQATHLIEYYRNARTRQGEDTSPAEIFMAMQTAAQFRIPGIRIVEAQQSHNLPAYNYLFTWKSTIPGLGSCHTLDIGFVFGNLSKNTCGTGPACDSLSMKIQDAWTAFSLTGNPSCESLGEWPVYGKYRKTMILGEECRVEDDPYKEERLAWNPVPNNFLG